MVTVGSDGAVTIRAVLPGTLQPDLWESKGSWYDPGSHRATFLVTDSASGFFNHWQPDAAALAALGQPARTYHVGPYTVYVWDKNLLVRAASQPGPVTPASRPDAVVRGRRDVALACGPANIRGRERVRRYVHLPRAAAALARRGGALPLPARGVMGP